MFRVKIILFLVFCSLTSIAQTDTTQTYGIIKIAKSKNKTTVKAYTEFAVYNTSPEKRFATYGDYVRSTPNLQAITNSFRFIITEARPIAADGDTFDYSSYFQKNYYTKDIILPPDENDTVRFYVYIDNKGDVTFCDLSAYGKLGADTIIFNNKNEYKVDITHFKTKKAFEQLAYDNWKPAVIQELKTHPSKRKKKYFSYNGYTVGLLTIIYSSTSFKE